MSHMTAELLLSVSKVGGKWVMVMWMSGLRFRLLLAFLLNPFIGGKVRVETSRNVAIGDFRHNRTIRNGLRCAVDSRLREEVKEDVLPILLVQQKRRSI